MTGITAVSVRRLVEFAFSAIPEEQLGTEKGLHVVGDLYFVLTVWGCVPRRERIGATLYLMDLLTGEATLFNKEARLLEENNIRR